ncbi:MAG: DUF89 family protein [Clostridia bacterium]|nr:DUF89 family protein [Clostridia bacterium]
MKIENRCIPCVTRQLVELSERLTQDETIQQKIIKFGLNTIRNYGFQSSAPYVLGKIYDYARRETGIVDPYLIEKKSFNMIAEEMLETYKLKSLIENSNSPLETGIRLSIAGNIIDFGLGKAIKPIHVSESIETSLKVKLYGDSLNLLIDEIHSAKHIVVIGDNAGEIVFDRLLIEQINSKVTYIVKGGPIVNDATRIDAEDVGMHKVAHVVDTGAPYQGVILSEIPESLRELMDQADLIISKGQANFETLSEYNHSNMFFLLRAKCTVIANLIGCKENDFVCIKHEL